MRNIAIATSILLLSGGVAFAQDADKSKSSGDAPAASGQNPSASQKMSPGTTGAMQAPAGGVATSPQDVRKQGGMETAPTTGGDDKAKAGDGDKPK